MKRDGFNRMIRTKPKRIVLRFVFGPRMSFEEFQRLFRD
jgi:hypothetical protein